MMARKFNKVVQIWDINGKTADGFGGYIPILINRGSFWCEIKTSNSVYNVDEGKRERFENLTFTFRKGVPITKTSYFVYRDEKYIQKGVPTNRNFLDTEIVISVVNATD